MRRLTSKSVQVHEHWTDGVSSVQIEEMPIRWCDIRRIGIKRKKDKTTGKPFLLQEIYYPGPYYENESLN